MPSYEPSTSIGLSPKRTDINLNVAILPRHSLWPLLDNNHMCSHLCTTFSDVPKLYLVDDLLHLCGKGAFVK